MLYTKKMVAEIATEMLLEGFVLGASVTVLCASGLKSLERRRETNALNKLGISSDNVSEISNVVLAYLMIRGVDENRALYLSQDIYNVLMFQKLDEVEVVLPELQMKLVVKKEGAEYRIFGKML